MIAIIKAFLFDLDGTIWDSEDVMINVLQEVILKEKGQSVEKRVLVKDLRVNYYPLTVLRNYGIQNYNTYWKIYRDNFENTTLFYDNTHKIFESLLELNKLIGYITSLKKDFSIKLIKKFKLDQFPSVIITPSECRATKPNPKPIILALKKLNVNPEEAIYIGDQDIDIIAAKRANCISGLALWGSHGRLRMDPDFEFKSLEDVLKLARGGYSNEISL